MLSNQFQTLLVILFFFLITALVAYAIYCRQKSHSFTGTGKVAEIEAWHLKSVISWIATFGLSLAAVVNYF